jgi:hypothetical protein
MLLAEVVLDLTFLPHHLREGRAGLQRFFEAVKQRDADEIGAGFLQGEEMFPGAAGKVCREVLDERPFQFLCSRVVQDAGKSPQDGNQSGSSPSPVLSPARIQERLNRAMLPPPRGPPSKNRYTQPSDGVPGRPALREE